MKSKLLIIIPILIIVYITCQSQWVQVSSGIGTSVPISGFVIKGDSLYASSPAGVFLTTNNGINWISKNNGLLVTHTLSIVISGNNLFAGTIGGVFKSTNGGESWTLVLPGRKIAALTVNYYNRLIAGTEGYGIYVSSDNGSNWIQSNTGITDLNIKCLSNHSLTFAGTPTAGIFGSYDGGSFWGTYNYNLSNPNITAISGQETSVLYAGTLTAGIYKFTGVSSGWLQVNNGLNTLSIRSLKTTGSCVFAGTNNSVCMSTNYGENWIVKNEGFGTQGYGVNVLEVYHGYIFAGTAYQSVWRRNFSEITGLSSINNSIPEFYKLHQNYPNPFNPSTTIRFNVKSELKSGKSNVKSEIRLIIYNSLGQQVGTLVNEKLNAGEYEITWNAGSLPSGVYFYQLKTNKFVETKKMMLLK